MLYRIFEIVSPIYVVVLVGFLYAKFKKPSMDAANAANIDVFVPVLILAVFAGQPINIADYTPVIILVALITLIPGLLSLVVCRFTNIEWRTLAPPMMFKNSGNLGIPLFILTFGEEYLPVIIMMFIVENTLHFSVGLWMLSPKDRSLVFLKQPMILATIIGITLSVFNVLLPTWLVTSLGMLGDVAVPLMLFTLGVRLVDLDFHGWRIGLLGAILAPVLGVMALAPFIAFFDLSETYSDMVWLFAVLPPAVLNFLVAERYKQEPDKVASIVLFANAASLLIIPSVLFILL